MSGQGEQGGGDIRRSVLELEKYCNRRSSDEFTLEGLQEKIAGIPADAVGDSDFLRQGLILMDAHFFHRACENERVTLEIVDCLLAAFPWTDRSTDKYDRSPLHCACRNENPDPRIVRLLLERWPESVNHQSRYGELPLHRLCGTGGSVDETASLAVLNLLLAAAPQSVDEFDDDGRLPIHIASRMGRSYPFCKRLIDAYPESPRVQSLGCLPIHLACYGGGVETVKCILELDPESIGARGTGGALPIHYAAGYDGRHKAGIIRYLLSKDPTCASKRNSRQSLPLHLACLRDCLDTARLLFDAYPEVITIQNGDGMTPIDLARRPGNDEIVEFLEVQLAYARQAEDRRAMTTPDENGWLPLHHALRNKASLGAIKLLIAGNRDALQASDRQSAFPLHIACEFSSVGVVQYLLGLSGTHLHTLDLERKSTLHYAIRGGNLGAFNCLLERGAPFVSEPDGNGKLPIHLLWESDRVDRDSVGYVEANWLLLLAHPETVTL